MIERKRETEMMKMKLVTKRWESSNNAYFIATTVVQSTCKRHSGFSLKDGFKKFKHSCASLKAWSTKNWIYLFFKNNFILSWQSDGYRFYAPKKWHTLIELSVWLPFKGHNSLANTALVCLWISVATFNPSYGCYSRVTHNLFCAGFMRTEVYKIIVFPVFICRIISI